jgi:hypothetical protein
VVFRRLEAGLPQTFVKLVEVYLLIPDSEKSPRVSEEAYPSLPDLTVMLTQIMITVHLTHVYGRMNPLAATLSGRKLELSDPA